MHVLIMNRGCAAQRGVALILVMCAVAIVSAVAMSVLSGLPATARAAQNLVLRDSAIYLAESGLVEALEHLENPPGDGEWTGVVGRQLPGVTGTYDVTVTDMGDGQYLIESTGHVPGAAQGSVSHTLAMTASVVSGGGGSGNVYNMQHAMLFGAGGFVPGNTFIRGDLFVPGNILNFGTIDGTLSASGSIIDLGQTQGIESNADDVDIPEIDVEAYQSYSHNGSTQNAMTLSQQDAEDLDGNIEPNTAGNALGVIVVDGNMELSDDVTIKGGILVVRGNLELNGHKLRIEGPKGDKTVALIVEGNAEFNRANSGLEVRDGVTYVAGEITNGWTARNSVLRARNGLIAKQGLPLAFHGQIEVQWDNNGGQGMDVKFFGTGGDAGGSGGSEGRIVTPLSYIVNPGS